MHRVCLQYYRVRLDIRSAINVSHGDGLRFCSRLVLQHMIDDPLDPGSRRAQAPIGDEDQLGQEAACVVAAIECGSARS